MPSRQVRSEQGTGRWPALGIATAAVLTVAATVHFGGLTWDLGERAAWYLMALVGVVVVPLLVSVMSSPQRRFFRAGWGVVFGLLAVLMATSAAGAAPLSLPFEPLAAGVAVGTGTAAAVGLAPDTGVRITMRLAAVVGLVVAALLVLPAFSPLVPAVAVLAVGATDEFHDRRERAHGVR